MDRFWREFARVKRFRLADRALEFARGLESARRERERPRTPSRSRMLPFVLFRFKRRRPPIAAAIKPGFLL